GNLQIKEPFTFFISTQFEKSIGNPLLDYNSKHF
ncbi:hypothetical protein LCGC14_2645160, partial [marine sediment metagenome]